MLSRDERTPRVLTTHVGLGTDLPASVVVATTTVGATVAGTLVDGAGTRTTLPDAVAATTPGWSVGPHARLELPSDLAPGEWTLDVTDGSGSASVSLTVAPDLLQRAVLPDVLAYFRGQRSSGEIDRKDRAARLWGDTTGRTVDARGGWLDASGDTSKFLSHLTYTTAMSPQQTPLCAWAFMAARDELARRHPAVVRAVGTRLRDEALWGADFLVRFQAPEGYFYVGIFDALTKELDERVINAPIQDCGRTDRYQAGYRHGGGLAIAALARAATLDDDGDLTREQYLAAARRGFEHLEAHNVEHLWDGRENALDDACALLAAAELVAAGESDARSAAERRASSLVARYVRPVDGHGWFDLDGTGTPFFHAAEPGLPVVALLRAADVLGGALADDARAVAVRAMTDVLDRTSAVVNPFGYPRQLTQPLGGGPRDSFFFPHANETGYWWQGENAGISSLATAALLAADHAAPGLRERLRAFASDQVGWVLGRNPFDVCMLQGRGRGVVEYESDFPNAPGGIVNGITSGWTDEDDIAFLPHEAPPGDSWRWSEQWIPHTAWFALAVATL